MAVTPKDSFIQSGKTGKKLENMKKKVIAWHQRNMTCAYNIFLIRYVPDKDKNETQGLQTFSCCITKYLKFTFSKIRQNLPVFL